MSGLLLDTCAIIWTGHNQRMSRASLSGMAEALGRAELFASPISAWELSLLSARGRLSLTLDVESWFQTYLRRGGVLMTELSVKVLIAANQLPGDPPQDPADRIIVATARHFGLTVVTRDRLILAYGASGLVQTLAC